MQGERAIFAEKTKIRERAKNEEETKSVERI